MSTSRQKSILIALASLTLLAVAIAHAAVDLNFFTGRWDGNAVVLDFETGSEVDHAAFNIYRSEQNLPISNGRINTANATKLNSSPILNPNEICGLSGYRYSYRDTTVNPSRNTYYYYLESLDCSGGNSVFYGDGNNGLAVSRNAQASPTRTPSASPTTGSAPPSPTSDSSQPAPPSPTATEESSAPGTTPTRTPTRTATRAASTTRAATSTTRASQPATATPRTSLPASPTRFATAVLPPVGTEVTLPGRGQPMPSPSPTIALAPGNPATPPAPAAGGEVGSSSRSSLTLQLITPTAISVPPTLPTGSDTLVAGELATDPLDRIMQGLIGLMLLGIAALMGLLGWIYVKR